jgi:hypothetical protein
MTLWEQIAAEYKEALKAHEDVKKSALNFLLAQIKNKKIELQKDPEDADVLALIKKEVKALNETIGYLEKIDNPAKLAEEHAKKAYLEVYLPATFSKHQTQELIQKLIQELSIQDLKTQRGLLMKELMANYKSQIDSQLVNEVINEMLV